MKVVPVGSPSSIPTTSESAPGSSPDRIARATAVASGKAPETVKATPERAPSVSNGVQSIKMKTQATVHRDLPFETAQSNISDNNEQANPDAEETKPISPQIAAIAKKQRALAEKEREIEARERALAQDPNTKTDQELRSRLKSNPLSVLQEEGVTYDQLTEAILSQQNEQSPAVQKLQAELEALRQGLENQNKLQAERDEAAKAQVLSQMERDAAKMIANNDEFEMVRETNSLKDVIRLIDQTFTKTGEVLDVDEALKLVEDQLLEDSLKVAKYKKVQSRLVPTETQQQTKQNTNPVRTMRTLTSRDGASRPSSARERAIAAFYGRK